MEKGNKILTLLLIIFFPLGIVFCIGKNLFSRDFWSFLGGLLLFACGFVLAIYLFRYDIIEPIITFFSNFIK